MDLPVPSLVDLFKTTQRLYYTEQHELFSSMRVAQHGDAKVTKDFVEAAFESRSKPEPQVKAEAQKKTAGAIERLMRDFGS